MFMGEKFGRDSIWETHLAEELWITEVDLEAVVDTQIMRLSEVYNLKVGSRIMLSATPDSDIYLNCGDIQMYTGRMGRKGDRIAIQIGDRVAKEPNKQIK
jgi:flagellar motor switch protein FliM